MSAPTRRQAAAAAGLMALGVLITPATAAARPDPGTAVQSPPASTKTVCPLRRIGDRLVVCDNLTGAGVTAPRWVPEDDVDSRSYVRLPAPDKGPDVQTMAVRRPGRGGAAQP